MTLRVHHLLACSLLMAGTLTAQQQPAIIMPNSTSGIAPNGIGATTGELLFSQPYGATTGQARGVYSVTNISGTSSPLSANATLLFGLPQNGNAENYFSISSGLGGFTAGAVYVTNPSSSSTDAVYKNGTLFIAGVPDSSPGHGFVTFDTVGTFGFAMIVTTASGAYGFNSAGALLFAYPAPVGYLLESATVAPASNPGCAGCMYLTSESVAHAGNPNDTTPGNIYVVKPGSPSGMALTLAAAVPNGYYEPENIMFVPPQLCTLSGTNFSYFVSAYAAGAQRFVPSGTNSGGLLAYTNQQVAPIAGKALVPFEGSPTIDGTIFVFNPATNTFSQFSAPMSPASQLYQLEGASIIACSPGTGCPATFGYWKHHAFPSSMFSNGVVSIAGVNYTASQLVNILDTPPAGGDAALILMHQLIAALANEAAGAKSAGVVEDGVPVNLAIAQAIELLQNGLPQPGFPGTNPPGVTFPINFNASSGNFVQAGSTLGGYLTTLSNVLNDYNSAVGLNCNEGSGLTTP